jgi:predicted GNAT family acetyltransferase
MSERTKSPAVAGVDGATIRHDKAGGFYEVLVDGASVGLLVYGLEGTRRVFTHVFINEEYRGRSLASLLVRTALDDIRADGAPSRTTARSWAGSSTPTPSTCRSSTQNTPAGGVVARPTSPMSATGHDPSGADLGTVKTVDLPALTGQASVRPANL